MVLRLLIDAVHAEETRVVIADNSRIHEFDFVTAAKKQLKGNIYLAKITRVEPSLQAAFVEYGGGKQGFLPFAEIHPDYYQIPVADRQRLIDEAEDAPEREETPAAQTTAEAASEVAEIKAEEKAFDPAVTAAEQTAEAATLPPPEEIPASAEAYTPPAATEEPHTESSSEPPAAGQPAHGGETSGGEASGGEVSLPEAHPPQEVETLASDEDAVRSARPASFYRRYKMQEVIKRNQIVLVQVIKEERGNKGVSLTTFISLAGRYCVLMPNSPKGGGISRKIMSNEDRRRLKEISSELKTVRGMSAIIRTAGIDRTRAEIKRDFEYLVQLWDTIREQTLAATAPALIYEESDLIKRTLRDLYSSDIEEILVEGEEGFTRAKDFLKMILPSHAPRVKLYEGQVPLFYAYNIEDQLASMHDPIVKLRSGGYIVLNPTEALISIDVNSGRSTGERNIEETATKTNLEAVSEIARQLRLRDLAGLIVIDLIDMMDSRNRRAVERALRDALKLDRAKIQLGRISPFGLLEMSRQRLRPSISETSSMPCPHCQGRGMVRSDASVAIQLIRAMEKEAAGGNYGELKPSVSPSVALHMLNGRRETLSAMEEKYGIRITILTDSALPQGSFRLEKLKTAVRRPEMTTAAVQETMMEELPPLTEEEIAASASIHAPARAESEGVSSHEDRPRGERGGRGGRGGHGRRGGRRFRGQREEGMLPPPEAAPGEPQMVSEEAAPGPEGEAREPREPREPRQPREPRERRPRGERGGRGRRGGRRWREHREGREGGAPQMAEAGAPAADRPPMQEAAPQPPRSEPIARPPAYTPPPLSAQEPEGSKGKKGWWRRMVE